MEYPGELSAVMYVAERPSVMFAAGQGSWLTAEDGRRFLDFVQGWAVNSLGACRTFRSALVECRHLP